ncbi:MAG TPA: AsmA-like C-terminal domain-containing protein, partial [Candidatus Eisenbacteria bacterium]|nr:AsmA-like C-terminal domain-containing protein [Candidatus Eisenbacteria bacterium]
FDFEAPVLRAALLKKYLPLKLPEFARWREIVDAVNDGDLRVRKAGLAVELPAAGASAREARQFWFDVDARNLRLDPMHGFSLPLHVVAGRLELREGAIAVSGIQARYGASRILALEGQYRSGAEDHVALELRAQAELDLAQLHEQLQGGAFGARIAAAAAPLSELAGRGKLEVTARRNAQTPLQFEGTLTLDGARLRQGEFAFTDVAGSVLFTPDEIKAPKLRASLSGAPAEIQFLAKDYAAPGGSFDLRVESPGMKAGPALQAILGSRSIQDGGVVRGWVRYRGPLAANRDRKLTGSLDLVNVQIAIPPLTQPLRGVTGKLRIEESAVEFQNVKATVAGFASSFSGSWRFDQQPQLLFDLAFPRLDFDDILAPLDQETGGLYDRLHAVGRLSIGNGRFKTFEFSDLSTDVVVERRVWRLSHLSAQSTGGVVEGQVVISHKPERPAFALDGAVRGVPVQGFLHWIDARTTDMTGKVSLSGRLESAGADALERKRNLNGAFRMQIEDGTIHRFRILVQILNLLDLSRWFTLQVPDLGKQGIRFRSITGDFKVTQGILATERLVVDSDDLRMSGAGRIDLPNDELDFVVAVRPFAGLDTAIHTIPIIGRGIAAIKNSFLVASFAVKGPIDHPTITPAPLSTLSEVFYSVLGIPKRLIVDDSGDRGTRKEP